MPAEPMYRQIAEDLRARIEAGELPRGTQLPTELELRERYEASRNTVRDAVKWLINRGLVETRPGQGTFVVEKYDPFVTTLDSVSGLGGEGDAYVTVVSAGGRTAADSVPRIEIQPAAGKVAAELQLELGTPVVSRHQQRLIDGSPYSLQTTFYPMRLVDQGAAQLIQAKDIATGAVRYLEEALGIKQAGWRDRITVRAPDAIEAAFFKISDDGRIAVFETLRTGYDEDGHPFRLTVTTYPADRNEFVMNVGEVPPLVTPDPGGREHGASGLSAGEARTG
ncbi:MAG TPA: GntR family transcriptional regulator [Streptosporangiaceae bacterium]|nr:GntR family transcriptional regulator [Streptosporangiaceae bacterium]